jgi:hypothetical protein
MFMASSLDCSPAFDFLTVQTCVVFVCFTPELLRPCDICQQIKKNVRQWCGQRGRQFHRLSTATVARKRNKNQARSASTLRVSFLAVGRFAF